jgi:hypothetical protein
MMKRQAFGLLGCATVLLGAALGGSAQTPLTNDEIVMMVKSRLSEGVILTAIETAPSTSFDTTPTGLLALRTGNVRDKVILAIQKAASEKDKRASKFVMTNDDVIKMSSGKVRMSDAVITAAIQYAPATAFDVSPKGLVDLKMGKVSSNVIQIVQKTGTRKAVASEPEPAPKPAASTAKPAASTAKPAGSTAKPASPTKK